MSLCEGRATISRTSAAIASAPQIRLLTGGHPLDHAVQSARGIAPRTDDERGWRHDAGVLFVLRGAHVGDPLRVLSSGRYLVQEGHARVRHRPEPISGRSGPRKHGYDVWRYRSVAVTVTECVTTERRRGGLTLSRRGGRCYPSTRAQGIETMARLALQLFGGFRARLEPGGPLRLPTRKAEALLAYLAVPLASRTRGTSSRVSSGVTFLSSSSRESPPDTLPSPPCDRDPGGTCLRSTPTACRSYRPRSWWTWRRSAGGHPRCSGGACPGGGPVPGGLARRPRGGRPALRGLAVAERERLRKLILEALADC